MNSTIGRVRTAAVVLLHGKQTVEAGCAVIALKICMPVFHIFIFIASRIWLSGLQMPVPDLEGSMNRIDQIIPPDQEVYNAAKASWDAIAKPLGSFGELERMARKSLQYRDRRM